MIQSMTAYGRSEESGDWGEASCEIRSVNHRYLELNLRLPDSVRELEPTLRDRTRKTLSRGKIEVNFSFQANPSGNDSDLNLNTHLLSQLTQALDTVATQLTNAAPVDPLELLRWPGMVKGQDLDRDQLLEAALNGFDKALEGLVEHRLREGVELKSLVEQRLDAISNNVLDIRAKLPAILEQQKAKLLDKFEALKLEVDPERLEQELVYVAQKSDVDEELDRLDTHVAEVRRVLNQKGSIGRRLDFLMQELNREANTLSSKSIVSETTQAAVEMKVLIEQMREQIQNIE